MHLSKMFRNKKLVTLATVGVVAISGTAAYAYWTSTGSGSGTATAAAGANNLVISSNSPAGIYPGGNVAVTGNVHNPNTYSVSVGTVSAIITTSAAGCLPADFSFAPVAVNSTVAAGGDQAFSGSLVMADTAVNQDACKSAVITLTFSNTSA
jgi:hypothetical protein